MNEQDKSTNATSGSLRASTLQSGTVSTAGSGPRGASTSSKAIPFDARFSETAVARVVDYLAATDDATAELKADVQRTKYLAELAEAFAFKSLTVGGVADKQAEVQMDPAVQKKWEAHFVAVAAYEKARATRERGQLIFEGWRTASSNKRQGMV